MSSYIISIDLASSDGSIDGLVRAMNIVRRGKVKVMSMNMNRIGDFMKVEILVEGIEDEVNWVCNKLGKLYDIYRVNYTVVNLRPQVTQVAKMGEGNGQNI